MEDKKKIIEKRQFDNFDDFADGYRKTNDKVIEISGANSDCFSEYKIACP
jgi:hypothetical protein